MASTWNDSGWRSDAETWIRRRVDDVGRRVTAPIEQPHIRPWATAFRVATDAGVVWFKADMPELAYEVAVVEALAARRPDCMPRVLATDPARGWLLVEDAGERLRELQAEAPSLERWAHVVALHAQLQLDAVADTARLRDARVPDRTPATAVEAFARVLDDERSLRELNREPLTRDDVAALRALRPRLVDGAETLAALGLPDAIHHDDLHDANVFVDGDRYVFIDWGDSSISQPLLTLSVPLAYVTRRFGDAAVPYVRDAFLEPWTALRPRAELVASCDAALLLAEITGVLKWALIYSGLSDDELGEYGDVIARRLRWLLEHECA